MRKIRSTFLRFISNWESDFLVILQNAPRLPNMNRMVFSLISEKSLPRAIFPTSRDLRKHNVDPTDAYSAGRAPPRAPRAELERRSLKSLSPLQFQTFSRHAVLMAQSFVSVSVVCHVLNRLVTSLARVSGSGMCCFDTADARLLKKHRSLMFVSGELSGCISIRTDGSSVRPSASTLATRCCRCVLGHYQFC